MEGLRPEDPQRVGRYRLLKRLGAGGMGQVYLGQSPSGRPVAVKIIRGELADNPDFRQRFRQEVKAARRVSGMFTAPVVDADPDAPQPWMVTAFVSGPSLAGAVATSGPLSVRAVRILAAGLAEGLGSVHAAGLVHRDLKPSNVLLASDGPRIIDFGISRSAGTAGPTRAGGVIGSPGFMSPEQAKGEPVGPASDIFSLGSVLAYAATGEPPFGEGSPSVLLYRVVYEEPSLGGVPLELRPLIQRCLARDPAARPGTDDVLGELGSAEPAAGWLGWQAAADEQAAYPQHTVPSDVSRDPARRDGWPDDGVAAVAAGALAGDGLADVPADLAVADVAGHDDAPPELAAAGVAFRGASAAAADPGGAPSGPLPGPPEPHLPPAGPTEPPPGPDRRRRKRAVLAAAAVLGAVLAGTLALSLVPGPARGQHGAGPDVTDRPKASAPPAKPAALTSPAPGQTHAPLTASTDPPSSGASAGAASPGPTPSGSSPAGLAGAVVLAYFTAINDADWVSAWALGGDNLYASLAALISDYVGVSSEDVTILSVSGDTVVARVRTTRITGAVAVHTQTFVVENGVIVSRGPAPGG